MPKDKETESTEPDALLNEALKAFGFDRKYLASYRITEKHDVIMVTAGGSKITYTRGFPAGKIPFVSISGKRQ